MTLLLLLLTSNSRRVSTLDPRKLLPHKRDDDRGFFFAFESATLLSMHPRKILAIKLRALGDTVLMTAPLVELRHAYPDSEIHVAVLSPWASILEAHPAIDKVWAFERHSDRATRAKALARMAFRLRKEHYDCVVNFHASPSSSILSFATGAKLRSVHFHGHRDKNRYSTVVVPGKGVLKPVIERDMDTVRALGLSIPTGRMPSLKVLDSERTDAQAWLGQKGLNSPVLGLGLGASRPTKAWPLEKFAALAIDWCKDGKGGVIAFAGPDEEDRVLGFLGAIDELLTAQFPDLKERAAMRMRITTEHHLPVRKVAAVLSSLSAFVGNDSGPRHLAVAVGTPTVTLFGPEDPYEWHPYPVTLHPFLFVDQLACRRDAAPGMPAWCALNTCVTERHRCMQELSVEKTLAECLKVAR
jgi:ADP-heptose:LPS heptosyltransferase